MKSAPNSRVNLDKAIQRFAGDVTRANELRNLMANAIVAQMIGEGVVKGGTGLKFRYGESMSRVTLDLDTAWRTGLDEFLKDLKSRLDSGWNGFTGEVVVRRPASPRGIPFEYVMQPCDVRLSYLGRSWYTVQLEVGHNDIGDADDCDLVEVPVALGELFEHLAIPRPSPIPAMRLEYQVAQKLHGASAPSSKRAHDLIDLQLIMANGGIDMPLASDLCRKLFRYRQCQTWPPKIVKGETWDATYNGQRRDLPVLPTVDEAVAWANDLIAEIDIQRTRQ